MPPPVGWGSARTERETVRQRLARTFGADGEEIALVRNSSEGLQICQLGFDLRRGDEVLTTNQDYPRMIAAFEQRARREGIVLKQFSLPVPPRTTTRSSTGSGATSREDEAHPGVPHDQPHGPDPGREAGRRAGPRAGDSGDRGRRTIVRHLDFDHADSAVDYFATSLPQVAVRSAWPGMRTVKRDKIRDLWPLMAAPPRWRPTSASFEEIGTHPRPEPGHCEALTFMRGRRSAQAARLRHLREPLGSPPRAAA